MLIHLLVLVITVSFSCADSDPPDAMTMGPDQLQDNQPKHSSVPSLLEGSVDDQWRTQVQHLLTELVQVQTKLAKNQEEELKLLNILTTQGTQQIEELQTISRHQALLIENHQALLLQTSRIATHVHDVFRKDTVG